MVSPFLALPNSLSNTLTAWDYNTDQEVGRYLLSPIAGSDPSRTCFDIYGYLYVANRYQDTVIKLGMTSYREDIPFQTSTGSNTIPWGQESRVLREYHLKPNTYGSYLPGQTYTRTTGQGLRGIAVDHDRHLWVANYVNPTYIWKIDIATDEIIQQIAVGGNYSIYGAVYNHISNKVFFTPATGVAADFVAVNVDTGGIAIKNGASGGFYGVAIDTAGNMYRPNPSSKRVYKFDPNGDPLGYVTLLNGGATCCIYNNMLYVGSYFNNRLSVIRCFPFELIETYSLLSPTWDCHGIVGVNGNLYGMPYVGYNPINSFFRIPVALDGHIVPPPVQVYPVGTNQHYCYTDFVGYITTGCVGTPPIVAFTGAPLTGQAPLSVTFIDMTTNNPLTWQWTFDKIDGGVYAISTQQNPTIVFDQPGTYSVSLQCTNSCGYDRLAKPAYIHVVAQLDPPVADFAAVNRAGTVPLTVKFTDISLNDPTEWEWNFGDGHTSYQRNPIHVYEEVGSFNVSLIATNSAGSDTIVKGVYVQVSGPGLVANFTADVRSGMEPFTVHFIDTSYGPVTGYEWDFGDGSPHTLIRNPIHVYNSYGWFNVSLTVSTTDGGIDTLVKNKFIRVTAMAPVADFIADIQAGPAPLGVQFTDMSTGDPDGWQWYVYTQAGLREASTITQNFYYVFNDPGVYTVMLVVRRGTTRCKNKKFGYIEVS